MSLFLFLFTFKLCMGSVFSKWFFLFKSLKEDAQNPLFWRFFLYIDGFFLRKFPDKCLSLFSLHLLILLSLSHFHQHFQHFRCKQLQHHSLYLSLSWVAFEFFIRSERKWPVVVKEEEQRCPQNRMSFSHIRWKINLLLSLIAPPVLLLGVTLFSPNFTSFVQVSYVI